MELPPCGLYRTMARIGSVDAGRLVHFHNHGSPGPGIYLPREWRHNKAEFQAQGQVIEKLELLRFLEPLPSEGFYAVIQPFHCCEKQCRLFERNALLQLGYTAEAEPILFIPELVDAMLAVPAKGWKTQLLMIEHLQKLHVPATKREGSPAH
jgi:hypothetical protein